MTQTPVKPQPVRPPKPRRAPAFDALTAGLDALFAALEHPNRRVSRAARDALAQRADVPRERLWALLATTRRPVTAGHVVQLFARGERADSIAWLLNACALGPDAVRAQACVYLARWGDYRGPIAPDRLLPLAAALRRAWPWLPVEMVERFAHFGIAPPPPKSKPAPAAPAAPAAPVRAAAHVPAVVPNTGEWNGLCAVAEAVSRRSAPLDYQVGRVVLRRYVLPPRWPAPWRYLFRRR